MPAKIIVEYKIKVKNSNKLTLKGQKRARMKAAVAAKIIVAKIIVEYKIKVKNSNKLTMKGQERAYMEAAVAAAVEQQCSLRACYFSIHPT